MLSYGFPPLGSPTAKVLVLGSLPGRISLERSEYYANPENAFWAIVAAEIPDFPKEYAQRVARLRDCGIAVWDVLAAATRSGSLDSAISKDAVPNNFRAFFHAYPQIQLICFNGATASKLYRRYVVSTLTANQRGIAQQILPSTSPAHTRLTLTQKTKQWSVVWEGGARKLEGD